MNLKRICIVSASFTPFTLSLNLFGETKIYKAAPIKRRLTNYEKL